MLFSGCIGPLPHIPQRVDSTSTNGMVEIDPDLDLLGELSSSFKTTLNYDINIKRSDKGYADGPRIDFFVFSPVGIRQSSISDIYEGNQQIPDGNLYLHKQRIGEGITGHVTVPAGRTIVVIDNKSDRTSGEEAQGNASFELLRKSKNTRGDCKNTGEEKIKIVELKSHVKINRGVIVCHFTIPNANASSYNWKITVQSINNEIIRKSSIQKDECGAHYINKIRIDEDKIDVLDKLKVIIEAKDGGNTLKTSTWLNEHG